MEGSWEKLHYSAYEEMGHLGLGSDFGRMSDYGDNDQGLVFFMFH